MSAPALTPEYCERGYDNRGAVPEFAQYFRRWAEDSARVRTTPGVRVDLRYGQRPKETLDLFSGGGRRGLLIFIHGGYWRALDKSDHSFVAAPYVAAGFDVAVVNYDLCPSVDIGTITDECRNAFAWLVRHGADEGLCTANIVLSGHSAGGHIAAMLLATDWRAAGVDPGGIRGAVSVSGIFDLEPLRYTSLNQDLKLDAAGVAAWSPFHLPPLVAAPLLLAVGSRETPEFIRQTQLQWEAWPQARPAGAAGPLVLEGCHHFSALDCLADPAHPLLRQTMGLFG